MRLPEIFSVFNCQKPVLTPTYKKSIDNIPCKEYNITYKEYYDIGEYECLK